MKIDLQGVTDNVSRKQWEERGYLLPQYDIIQTAKTTKENPFWIHFGAGNLIKNTLLSETGSIPINQKDS